MVESKPSSSNVVWIVVALVAVAGIGLAVAMNSGSSRYENLSDDELAEKILLDRAEDTYAAMKKQGYEFGPGDIEAMKDRSSPQFRRARDQILLVIRHARAQQRDDEAIRREFRGR